MPRTISIGVQSFSKLREKSSFYIDKTGLIKEWWESDDEVTLITRPRRFGKTFNMDMLRTFFFTEFAGRGKLFEGLSIWQEEKYREMQGTWPTIFITFAGMKPDTYEKAISKFRLIVMQLYNKYSYLLDSKDISDSDKKYFKKVSSREKIDNIEDSINELSRLLCLHYKKNVIIVLDEYDTPIQEAYAKGYWDEIVDFMRSFFNATFKTNPYMHRAIMTGITRVSKESIFSDFNNVVIAGVLDDAYAEYFGFTEQEVFVAMDEYGLTNKDGVKHWYDGFIIGDLSDIYNPWSIVNYLKFKKLKSYWANSSENTIVGKLIRQSSADIKLEFETLLRGETINVSIDENIAYNNLFDNEDAIWSLLVATGYLKVKVADDEYFISVTNYETLKMFNKMVSAWFNSTKNKYNNFIKALLQNNVKVMNKYMNDVALNTFSYFDVGNRPSGDEPERFYHGFVLGLMVDLRDRFIITSNRESGFGRYDVMLEPRDKSKDNGFIIEFKVHDPDDEQNLQDTVAMALKQIDDMHYDTVLQEKGILVENIHKYGFAFQGKKVLIGT